MEENNYQELLKRYIEDKCNPSEVKQLMDYLTKDESNRSLLEHLKQQFEITTEENTTISTHQSNRIRENLLQHVIETPVVTMKNRRWKLVAAAAAVIIFVGSGLYIFNANQINNVTATVQSKVQNKSDIAPGGNKALLTLADGSTIILDEVQNGTLTQQGNTTIVKLDGKLNYDVSPSNSKAVLYNTITTPRGGQFQIILPDGSKVWLNAASSIHFPTSFAANERRVEISGEAYFEISKNKAKPFIVKVNDAEVQVLGTHFNLMAYYDEPVVKTTLLEGSVKFIKDHNTNILTPGQQSQLFKNGLVKVLNNVDPDEVLAWKNGTFQFNGTDIGMVTRQLSRWYDAEVVYDKKIDDLFYADIPRNTNLSDVLKALELTGKVHFEIQGKRIIVKP